MHVLSCEYGYLFLQGLNLTSFSTTAAFGMCQIISHGSRPSTVAVVIAIIDGACNRNIVPHSLAKSMEWNDILETQGTAIIGTNLGCHGATECEGLGYTLTAKYMMTRCNHRIYMRDFEANGTDHVL
jgi:hypothetical protein